MQHILVSSCLLGLKTRYDGTDNYSQDVMNFLIRNKLIAIPVCPEQLAGFPTPRPKCWFNCGDGTDVSDNSGQLLDETGRDVTKHFVHGAQETLKIAGLTGCSMAILQQRSPSCGSKTIYQNNQLKPGMGVTAAILKWNGLQIYSDDNLPPDKF